MTATTIATLTDLALFEERIAAVVVDWAPDRGIDWHDMLDRIEGTLDVDLPSDMAHPVIARIQRIGRTAVKEARS
jgi:hypothetical protein